MSTTKIEWTARPNAAGKLTAGYTWNPWIGCTHAGPECDFCYAEEIDGHYQYGGNKHWGPGRPRYLCSEDTWRKPYSWNRKAIREGWRPAVFTASMADWADTEVPREWQTRMLKVVDDCRHLEWLLLTKRPGHAKVLLESYFPAGIPDHIRVGTSVGTQAGTRRAVDLLKIDCSRFLSVEPLLGPVDLNPIIAPNGIYHPGTEHGTPPVDWVIVGGESGDNARPMNPKWAEEIAQDCWRHAVPFFFKQWGDWAPSEAVTDPQAKAMCLLGRVKTHQFEGPVFRVGKQTAGALFMGKHYRGLPSKPRRLTFSACACQACTPEPRTHEPTN